MYAFGRLTAVILFSLTILAGCAKSTDSSMDASSDAPSADSSDTATAEDGNVLVEMGLDDQSAQSGAEEENLLAHSAVYFGFDESIVSDRARQIIRAHAEVLVQNPDVDLNLSGHADERGTREYNLALGEQRAIAVSAFFQEYGVEASRITTVSFGEEMPAVTGSDEESWALNRRVEIAHDLVQ